MNLDTSRTIDELLRALSVAMDIVEGEELYHGLRVAIILEALGEELNLPEKKYLFYAALLHDIGSVGLPHHIVHYGLLDSVPQEPQLFAHPLISTEIIENIPGLQETSRAVLDHHENWNGHGYPRGRQCEEISIGGQLLYAADYLDLQLRKYEHGSLDKVLKAIKAGRNSLFSDRITELALDTLKYKLDGGIRDLRSLPQVFEAVRDRLGPVEVEAGIDAIGITLEVFAQVIDTKHPYTIGHSKRISRYVLLIGVAMGLKHDEITELKWAGLLHDIGKLGVPRRFLDKPSSLTKDEYERVKHHAQYTLDILLTIAGLRYLAPIAAGHHERIDGKGYPLGLKGEEIPLGARILSVADAFDAMTSHRPYRSNNEISKACQELTRGSGSQFDSEVVKEAIPVLSSLGTSIFKKDPTVSSKPSSRAYTSPGQSQNRSRTPLLSGKHS